jgi:hypothetical protein
VVPGQLIPHLNHSPLRSKSFITRFLRINDVDRSFGDSVGIAKVLDASDASTI